MRSPPCQAALPLYVGVTLQLCTQADIPTWLQQCHRQAYTPLKYDPY